MRLFLFAFILSTLSFYDEFREKMLRAKDSGGIVEPNGPGNTCGRNGIRSIPFDPSFKFDPNGVYFSGTFTNGTVLQRGNDKGGNRASVYGSAPPNSKVTLSMQQEDGSYAKSATMDANMKGEWKWTLPDAMQAGGNYTFVVGCDSCEGKTSMFNVTFGDVWYCAGQSNMELALRYTISRNISWNAYQNGSYHNIRIFQRFNSLNIADEDFTWVLPPGQSGVWVTEISEKDFMDFSAVCWYFGQELTNRLGGDGEAPPIGLIHMAIGGTMVEAWTRNHTLDDCVMPEEEGGYVCSDPNHAHICGGLFNGQVAPFVNTTIKGVLWWQGENNMHEPKGNIKNNTGYACMFLKMKNQWQEYWSGTPGTTEKEFGFGVVTLADGTSEGGKNMPEMRWAQTQNYGVIPNPEFPNGFMAAGHDLGDPWWGKSCWGGGNSNCAGWDEAVPFSSTKTNYYMGPIHPRVKFEVGRRLAVGALSVTYGRSEMPPAGPTIESCQFQMDRNNLDFTLQFNTKMMNPKGINNGSQYQLYVNTPFYPHIDGMPSVLNLLFNDTWVPATIKNQKKEDGQAGKVLFSYDLKGSDDMPTQIRYAWDQGGGQGGCCPGLDRGVLPCPPRSCPIMMKFNTTYAPTQIQALMTGLELGLPANPFWSKLIWDDSTKTGHCECFEPQVCS